MENMYNLCPWDSKTPWFPRLTVSNPFKASQTILNLLGPCMGGMGSSSECYNHNSTLALGTLTQFAVSSITSTPKCPWLRITIHLIASTFWAPGSSATTPVCPRSRTSSSWPWLQVLVVIGIKIIILRASFGWKLFFSGLTSLNHEASLTMSFVDGDWRDSPDNQVRDHGAGYVGLAMSVNVANLIMSELSWSLKNIQNGAPPPCLLFPLGQGQGRSKLLSWKFVFLFLALGQSLVHFLEQQGRFLLLQVNISTCYSS